MERERKAPDEVNSFEYLSEHLWQRAKDGGFEAEFGQLKVVLPYLNQFERLTDLIRLIKQGDEKLVNYLLTDLIRLYRTRQDLRPAIVIIIILILWSDLAAIYEELPPIKGLDERFADIYWDLFHRLQGLKLNEADKTRSEIVIQLRSKFIRR